MPFAKFEDTIAARGAGPAKFSLRSKLHVGSALVGVTAALVAFAPAPAMAATCPPTAAGTITCSNPLYMGGIYEAPTQDLTIVVEEGVTIDAIGGTGVAIEAYGQDITATIINHGTISNASDGLVSYDYGYGSTREATVITNTGSITAAYTGILVTSGGDTATVTNDGSITAATGINVQASQNVVVTGTGSIIGTATSGKGIYAKSNSGTALVATGSVTMTAAGAQGIYATGRTGATVQATSVSTVRAHAVRATSASGTVEVDVSGAITTMGNYARGVSAFAGADDVTVNVASVSTTGNNSHAVDARSYSGAVMVTATGAISTAGYYSTGVAAHSGDGDVIVSVASVTTTGYGSDALDVSSDTGAVTITATGAIATEGDGSTGVRAFGRNYYGTSNGTVTVDVASVSTKGEDADAIRARANHGAVSVTASGAISTAGYRSTGVDAYSTDGDVTVNVASVATTGYRSDALGASSNNGAVTINATGAITTEGDNATGVGAYSYNGDVTVNVASVSTAGQGSNAIDAYSYSGAVSVTATGAISTVGNFSRGVKAYSSDSDVTVKVASVATTGYASNAIDASSYSGAVSVTATGEISTADDYSTGVYAYSIDGDVSVNVASVATTGHASNAIDAYSNSGAVSVTATGAISTVGDFSRGVGAYSTDGDVTVNAASVSTTGYASNAIEASSNSGAVSVTATGDIMTAGVDARGVHVHSRNGDVSVNVASVTTTGASSNFDPYVYGSHAIFAISETGSVSVTASGTITTAADMTVGVFAVAGETTSLDIANVETAGQFGAGVGAMGQDVSGNIGRVSTQGDYATGVFVRSGTIDLAIGNVSTAGANADAIIALSSETLNLRVANASTQGARSDAVKASSHDGDISVTVTGAVSTAGNQSQGVQASSTYGNVEVNIGSSGARVATFARMAAAPGITTSGDDSHGIVAHSTNGTVTVASTGTIAVTGAGSNGINASAQGATTVIAGDTSAASGHAIHASSSSGLASVTATGTLHSADRAAILAEGATGVNVGIAAGGSVSGATSAIVANGPSTTITNAGTLNAGSAPTIVATGGTVDFTNSGTFNGNVHFGAGDDSITNTGRFLASGTSDFGAGNNVFTNSGLFVAAGSVELTNLETFNNSGVISLGNGAVGDVLTISGNYVGNGGQMVFDFRNSQGTVESDRIHILGNATGTTGIRLSNVGTAALPLGTQVKLIEVDGTTSAGAFSIAGGQNIGFGFYELEYDAATNSFNVSASVGENLFRTLKISEGAQVLWNKSADVWSAHLQSQRDGTAGQDASARGRIWGQFHGSIDKRSQTFVYEDAFATQNVDLSYRQDHFGGQMGVDFGSLDSTGLTYGVTGGYTNSSLKFAQSVDRTEYDAYNLGAYFGASRGSFFVNALAKYDLYKVKTSSPAGGFTDRFDGKGYGVQLEGGARLGGKGFFVEPIVGITYNRIDLNTLQALGATVEFEKFDGLRGKIGARLGGARVITGGVLTYYAGAHVVKEFEGKDGVRLNAGSYSERFANDPIGTYGQFQLGVNVASRNGVTGFFEANANTSEDYKGYGGRAGIRIGL